MKKLFLLLLAVIMIAGISVSANAAVYTWSGDIAIPDNDPNNPAIAEITISDSYLIGDLDVMVTIYHTWCADNDIFLESPSGTLVELSTDNGGSSDNYLEVWFDDEAGETIIGYENILPGYYTPEGDLSDFDGENVFGTWKLIVADDASLDTGTLNEFRMNISPVPVPGAIWLLGSGLLGLFGLRKKTI